MIKIYTVQDALIEINKQKDHIRRERKHLDDNYGTMSHQEWEKSLYSINISTDSIKTLLKWKLQ